MRNCYELGLLRDPTLGGRIDVRFLIGADGSVSSASVRSSTLNDEDVEGCVVREFQRLRLPAPDGGLVTVDYPLVFNTQ